MLRRVLPMTVVGVLLWAGAASASSHCTYGCVPPPLPDPPVTPVTPDIQDVSVITPTVVDPVTGLTVLVDPITGLVVLDPVTGLPVPVPTDPAAFPDLAKTGSSNIAPLVQGGFVLTGGGALLVFVARRRRIPAGAATA